MLYDMLRRRAWSLLNGLNVTWLGRWTTWVVNPRWKRPKAPSKARCIGNVCQQRSSCPARPEARTTAICRNIEKYGGKYHVLAIFLSWFLSCAKLTAKQSEGWTKTWSGPKLKISTNILWKAKCFALFMFVIDSRSITEKEMLVDSISLLRSSWPMEFRRPILSFHGTWLLLVLSWMVQEDARIMMWESAFAVIWRGCPIVEGRSILSDWNVGERNTSPVGNVVRKLMSTDFSVQINVKFWSFLVFLNLFGLRTIHQQRICQV